MYQTVLLNLKNKSVFENSENGKLSKTVFYDKSRKAFDDFNNKQKVYEVMLFDMQKYVYFESFSDTLYIEINYKQSKIFLKIKSILGRMHSFFFPKLQLIIVLFLILDLSIGTVRLSENVCGIFHF